MLTRVNLLNIYFNKKGCINILFLLAKIIFTRFLNNMNININNTNFGQKYPTGRILEITSRKIFEPDGMSGFIETLKQIHGNVPRYTGHQGFRRYAEEVSNKILPKYPELAKATEDIIEIAENNKSLFVKDLKIKVQPILDRFEKEIDIVI